MKNARKDRPDIMQERPPMKNKKAAHTSLLLMIAAVVGFALASSAGKLTFLVQALSILSAAIGISMLIRYQITDYLYTIEENSFSVRKINGKKSLLVADIPFSDMTAPMPAEPYKRYLADSGKKPRVYSFIKNMDSGDEYYIVCHLGGSDCTLRVELTEPFLSVLTETITRRKAQEQREENETDEEL